MSHEITATAAADEKPKEQVPQAAGESRTSLCTAKWKRRKRRKKPNGYDGKTALTKAAPLLVPNYQRLSRTFCALSICPIIDKQGGFSHLVERVTNGGPEPGHSRGGATAGSLHYPACTSSFGTGRAQWAQIKVIEKVRMDTTTQS
ncbi:hypothetical protein KOW79_018907 [Hemibagrus wyckioides]|uniref:Uncharacterized protein n=1 Tax=Hemibagrus wyckioides TaxID=337641 RepID=A0A9D3SBF8_9TELE|nr:hypothetical protein KOW79_018907 [Hemibagrus wyckioides]